MISNYVLVSSSLIIVFFWNGKNNNNRVEAVPFAPNEFQNFQKVLTGIGLIFLCFYSCCCNEQTIEFILENLTFCVSTGCFDSNDCNLKNITISDCPTIGIELRCNDAGFIKRL